MDKKERFEVSKLIKKAKKITMQEYCRKYLNINEKTFYYRLRVGQIKIKDALTIMKHTRRSYQYLFERFAIQTNAINARSGSSNHASKESEEEMYMRLRKIDQS